MSELALHGKPVQHTELLSGGYTSPEEYADQGDTRVIRDLMFGYTVTVSGPDGSEQVTAQDAFRGDEVSTEQIGLLALQKGEANHSFYTTEELEKIRNPLAAAATTASVNSNNLAEQGEYELSDWLATGDAGTPPTIDEVLEAVGSDKELAHRMLQAENVRTDGDPRKGLEQGLTRIIQG